MHQPKVVGCCFIETFYEMLILHVQSMFPVSISVSGSTPPLCAILPFLAQMFEWLGGGGVLCMWWVLKMFCGHSDNGSYFTMNFNNS